MEEKFQRSGVLGSSGSAPPGYDVGLAFSGRAHAFEHIGTRMPDVTN
jgi:hypothetical protein